jgi:flavin reductase (DIM6/NTAB) family NADH-FMN oxidoreductase RutF
MAATAETDSFTGSDELTPEVLRRAFGAFPSGVTAVAGLVAGQPVGMAASSFTSVSLDPPLVSVCVAHSSTTWPVLRAAESIGVSVLADGHADVARAMAARTGDRFGQLDWQADDLGAVFVDGAALWLRCSVRSQLTAGDHLIVLLTVEKVDIFGGVDPLIFHASNFRRLGV